MDGNRRWARNKKLPEFEGHRIGEQKIEPIIDTAIELGIPYLTFWAFSTENWYRSKKEVAFLMGLYRNDLNKKVDSFHAKNVRIKIIGNLSMFPKDLQEKTARWVERTKNNKKITVNIALSYGGRDEIIRAIGKWRENPKSENPASSAGRQKSKLTEDEFSKYLDTSGQPDPDLLIRTGGEKRLSGFLLWQLEYAELYFTDVLWPDFTPFEFKLAIDDFVNRQRRFGK